MPNTGRAFGKAILIGEHAVVYGAPGIVVGLEQGARASVGPATHTSCLRLGGIQTLCNDPSPLGRALAALLAVDPAVEQAIEIDVQVELPMASGLGSSAAVAVAIARALGADHVVDRALAWERVFHGNPSGIDIQAACHGGVLQFRKDLGAQPVPGSPDLQLAIGLSGTTASTKTMVDQVARRFAEHPKERIQFCNAVTALAENALLALGARDYIALGRLLDLNHMLLAGLMLSTSEIEDLVRTARAHGALGAKLTGKGGGGAVVALVDPQKGEQGSQVILEAWARSGYTGFSARVSGGSAA